MFLNIFGLPRTTLLIEICWPVVLIVPFSFTHSPRGASSFQKRNGLSRGDRGLQKCSDFKSLNSNQVQNHPIIFNYLSKSFKQSQLLKTVV